jgi:hypothetical protein
MDHRDRTGARGENTVNARIALAMVLLAGAGVASAAELGRMFFTPAQRAALDSARRQNIRTDIGNEDGERTAAAAAPLPQTVRVNGLIQRSDGKNTVWLNNKPITEKSSGGLNITTRRGDTRINLSQPDSGRSMDLKVGQTAEMVSGTVEENYRRRLPAKIEEKPALPADNNVVPAVQKRTAEAAPESIESSPRLQRKARAAARDAQDETPASGGPDTR